MRNFSCPYLNCDVELTTEREAHIERTHPELLPLYLNQIGKTLQAPDQIRRSSRLKGARIFSRWFSNVLRGKHVVVVVVSELLTDRHWIITAYVARRLAKGDLEWERS